MAFGYTYATVQKAIRDWLIIDSTLTTVILTNQQHARPAYPYGAFNIIAGPTYDGRFTEKLAYNAVDDDIDISHRSIGTLTVSCQFYSDDPTVHAQDLAATALANLQLITTRDALESTGNMAALTNDGVTNLDFVAGDQWTTRAGINVIMSIGLVVDETVDTIETVEIDSTLTDPGGDTISVTDTIP